MKLSKRLLKHPRTQAMISLLLSLYIRFVYATSRIERHIDPLAERYMHGEANALFAFWHGRMMLLPCFEPPGRKMHVLISFHRDGKLISDTIAHFGEATINGSSSRGGMAAMREIARALKSGDNVSITPDGPRGPAQEAQGGIVTAAKLTGKPVLPVTFSSTRCRRFKSWDRFMLALPFGRIAFCVGAPIMVDREMDASGEETARLHIERAMNALVHQADGMTHA